MLTWNIRIPQFRGNERWRLFSYLTGEDRRSPSGHSADSTLNQKKRFFVRNTNESKFYDTETDEKTVQNQDANVVQLVGQDRDNKMRNGSVKYHMNIPITRQGRLTLIKSLVRHYIDIVDEVLVDMIPKIILKCMVYKFRTDMSEGSCILNRIKKDEKEEELLAVDSGNIPRMKKMKRESEKLSRGINIMESFQNNLTHK